MLAIPSKALSEWLNELENRHPQAIRLGLTRIMQVAKTMHLLTPNAIVVTVGGTNGKGSTVAALEAIYHQAGYKVGSYTSPHLLAFNERIRINKRSVSDQQLVTAFEHIEEARSEIELTYFEMATLAALYCFQQQKLDIIILEVGLGGRLDATNSIESDLAIITTVALDHQEYLGSTIEAIAHEKAGILRANKPFIYADHNAAQRLCAYAKSIQAKGYYLGQDYSYESTDNEFTVCFQGKTCSLPQHSFHPNSVAAAVLASHLLNDVLPLTDDARRQGLSHIDLKGRFQQINGSITTILDVTHNPQAALYLRQQLMEKFPSKKIHAVFSALADKDLLGIICPLLPCISQWYPSLLPSRRTSSAQQLLQAFKDAGVNQNVCYNDPFLAYQAALKCAKEGDLILVFGSLIMVGCVLSALSHASVAKEEL